MRKFLRLLAAALAFSGAIGTASAQVMTFDNLDTSLAPFAPFVGHFDTLSEGDYAVTMVSTKAGAQAGDLVGALMDSSSCFSVQCPVNNATSFLGSLNDGGSAFFRADGGLFNLTQFDASFLGAEGVPIPGISLVLQVFGYDALGVQTGFAQINFPGLTNGDLSFATYAMNSAFASTLFAEVDMIGFACNAAGSCNRTTNLAQFAVDNVTFAAPVPEPSTWALLCLGLIGIAVIRRRATAKA